MGGTNMNEKTQASKVSTGWAAVSSIISKYTIFIILLVLIVIFAIVEPMFLTTKNIINLMTS